MNNILEKINSLAKRINRTIVLMELCGTHTEAVARHGIKRLLPKNIKLLSGPGCPVCVTDQKDINAIIALALKGIPIACYGDVLRVPGTIVALSPSKGNMVRQAHHDIKAISLNKARELGADTTEVYSVEDALELQKKKPNLVFFGLGFETTAPMTASAIKRSLTVYSSHKAFVPAMAALLATPTLKIDGFINPGHVSTIIGIEPYKKLKSSSEKYPTLPPLKGEGQKIDARLKSKKHSLILRLFPSKRDSAFNLYQSRSGIGGVRGGIPQVIAGFEANDVIIAIYMLLKQIAENRAEVENQYTRAVRPEGNPKARELINEVFETGDAYWRGIGKIPDSGFEIRPKYSKFDAKVKYKNILSDCHPELVEGPTACICGAILRGLKEPQDCKLFNKKCTPENPVGACMVSSEGACGIEAKFKK